MDVVSEMNQDIYNFELDEQERADAEIDREVNDLSGLADDDDYGDRDGDQDFRFLEKIKILKNNLFIYY